jgi:hypothetical protein
MSPPTDGKVRLDLNNPTFQEQFFDLPKDVRHATVETMKKLRQMTWDQVYRDNGLKWEKIATPPPVGISAVYSLRITQSRRAIVYRHGDFIRFESIPPDHDATYGKK